MDYTFSAKAKRNLFMTIGAGLLLLVLGLMFGGDAHHDAHGDHGHAPGMSDRFWGNLLTNGFFFFGVGLMGVFFIAKHYAAEAGYGIVIKRLWEAQSNWIMVGGGVLLLVIFAGVMHWHHIYHWMAEGIADPNHENYDSIIAGKTAFLNPGFMIGATIVFVGFYVWVAKKYRDRSLQEDQEGGVEIHKKNITLSAAFLVVFGFSSVVLIWFWLMSIDTHWFSTLYGWYVFSGMWISCIIMTILMIGHLKNKGLLQEVNINHMHDMGKWMFAISFLWGYLWFCQFMLIWYSDIPEEVTYYITRIKDYKILFFGMFIVNSLFPMLMLMDRDAKRSRKWTFAIGCIIFMTHWVDVYLLIMPAVMKGGGGIGLMEIGMFLIFLGAFLYVTMNALSKRPLVVKNHPFLDESKHLEVN